MDILEFNKSHRESWDDFVGSRSEAKICHFLCYKQFIEEAFGYKPVYWLFRKKDKVVGIFPSFEYRNLLGMKFWISQPFIEYGGVLSEVLSDEDWMQFRKRVEHKLKRDRLPALRMNGFEGKDDIFYREKIGERGYLNLQMPELIWKDDLDSQARKAVKKAINSGLKCYEETNEQSIKWKFYPLYLESMKRLGSPPFSIRYFLIKFAAFGNRMKLFFVEDRANEIVAGLMGYVFGQNVFIEFSVCKKSGLPERPNDLVHWKFIEWASKNGYKYFDFGSIRYDSQKRFKQKWGVEIKDYINSYVLHTERSRKHYYLESNDDSIQILSKMWGIFMPKLLAKWLGPILHKQLVK